MVYVDVYDSRPILNLFKNIQNNFVLAGDKEFYQNLIDEYSLEVNLIDKKSKEKGVIFEHFPLKNEVSLGNPDVSNTNYIMEVLSYGALGSLNKRFKGLITGPINKELINKSGFEFSGHTEFLAEISNTKKVVMLLTNDKLKIALLTTHIPLSEVPSKVTKKNLQETVSIILKELKNVWKIEDPIVCLLGLNPHAGEGGFLGHEEEEILKPFVDASGNNILGPISADTAFIKKNLSKINNFTANSISDFLSGPGTTEVKMKGRMRDKTHPNTLVGTTGYLKNAMAATGTKKIKNFDIKEFINKYRKK